MNAHEEPGAWRRSGWFVTAAGIVGDLGSPFYREERRRDVWNEASAVVMGLPVPLTKVSVYVISGFCATRGAVLCTVKAVQSGNPQHAIGMELIVFEPDAVPLRVIFDQIDTSRGLGAPKHWRSAADD